MPFISEELWQNMEERKEGETIMYAPAPEAKPYDPQVLVNFALAEEAVNGVRGIRNQKNIAPKETLDLKIKGGFPADVLPVVEKMGNVKDLMGMIPGMGKLIRNMDIDDNVFKSVEVMIQSMTPEERANPDIINGSRRKRIARGSGRDIQDVNRLIKQFDDIRKVMKAVNNGSGKTKGMMRAMKARGRR